MKEKENEKEICYTNEKAFMYDESSLKHHPTTYLVGMYMYVGGLRAHLEIRKKGTQKHAGVYLYRIPNRYVSFCAKQTLLLNPYCHLGSPVSRDTCLGGQRPHQWTNGRSLPSNNPIIC